MSCDRNKVLDANVRLWLLGFARLIANVVDMGSKLALPEELRLLAVPRLAL